MSDERTMTDAEIEQYLEKLYFKIAEIHAIMKKGEFIPAHEKLGGVLKNVHTLRVEMQRRLKA